MNSGGVFGNKLELEIICADIAGFINAICDFGTELHQVIRQDDLTVRILIKSKDFRMALKVAEKYDASVTVTRKTGFINWAKKFAQRPVIVIFICIFGIFFIDFIVWRKANEVGAFLFCLPNGFACCYAIFFCHIVFG